MSKKRDPATALITGASAGIGAALAREFAAHGHSLLLVARSKPRLEALAEEIERDHGVRCDICSTDLHEANAPQRLFDHAQAAGIEVGVLVNNAGTLLEGAFAELPLADQLGLLQLNLSAPLALMHLFVQRMRARRSGRILNIVSTSAFNPVPSLAVYAASKAALLSLSEALALELRGSGVSVTAVCPGFTDTAMIERDGGGSMRLPLIPNLTPERVAREAYRAGMAGRPLVINGLGNRLSVEGLRHTPLALRRELIAAVKRWGF
ncbi:SDR family NAD(P)-dependent oxidoreductase [Sinimarinibacterium thermocellulolyticum]|uniref:SDR family oxidoreductase n=1 Tax=Sinimarinibacterium thermocellulolyticum TaxID=3170016 RepID=A0ABV2A7B1_9GAMM